MINCQTLTSCRDLRQEKCVESRINRLQSLVQNWPRLPEQVYFVSTLKGKVTRSLCFFFWNCFVTRFCKTCTVEPRFNEPLFNEVLDITNQILCPGQSYSKMYGIKPQYNEPRYNEFFDITNIIRNPKCEIYLDITNYNVNTRQKINAEQIKSQHIL